MLSDEQSRNSDLGSRHGMDKGRADSRPEEASPRSLPVNHPNGNGPAVSPAVTYREYAVSVKGRRHGGRWWNSSARNATVSPIVYFTAAGRVRDAL
jgi:hypothetical protein